VDNAVTRQWDKHMRRDWREGATANEAELAKPRDREADRKTVAELNQKLEEARPVLDEQASLAKRAQTTSSFNDRCRRQRASGEWSQRKSRKLGARTRPSAGFSDLSDR